MSRLRPRPGGQQTYNSHRIGAQEADTYKQKHRPARLKAAGAAERRMPKMHWRWRRRGRDIEALLQARFGSVLPDDDYGVDAAKLLAQHYLRLLIDGERVAKANLRLRAPWLEEAIADVIAGAKEATTPSAAQLGRDFRVTADEVAELRLETIVAFTVTRANDREGQARRRRKAGAGTKRGRPALQLTPEEMQARCRAQANERQRRRRASRKNSQAVAYVERMELDELSVTGNEHSGSRAPQAPRHAQDLIIMDPDIIDLIPLVATRGGCASAAPPLQLLQRAVAGARHLRIKSESLSKGPL